MEKPKDLPKPSLQVGFTMQEINGSDYGVMLSVWGAGKHVVKFRRTARTNGVSVTLEESRPMFEFTPSSRYVNVHFFNGAAMIGSFTLSMNERVTVGQTLFDRVELVVSNVNKQITPGVLVKAIPYNFRDFGTGFEFWVPQETIASRMPEWSSRLLDLIEDARKSRDAFLASAAERGRDEESWKEIVEQKRAAEAALLESPGLFQDAVFTKEWVDRGARLKALQGRLWDPGSLPARHQLASMYDQKIRDLNRVFLADAGVEPELW